MLGRAERRFRTALVVKKRVRMVRGLDGWEREPGRFRKMDPIDCGHTRCGVCRYNRRWLGPTRQELTHVGTP